VQLLVCVLIRKQFLCA